VLVDGADDLARQSPVGPVVGYCVGMTLTAWMSIPAASIAINLLLISVSSGA
jgi:hypothetical protein